MIVERTQEYHDGDAKYPDWVVPKSRLEVIYKSPIRIIYFILAPFPWDIKKPIHLIGLLDSILFLFVVYMIIKNTKFILKDQY